MISSISTRSSNFKLLSWNLTLFFLLTPTLAVIIPLFGGGLLFGILQSLGYLPSAGFSESGFLHYLNVLKNPDFLESLLLTFYIAGASTLISAITAMGISVLLTEYSHKSGWFYFIFQIPLTVPHLVIAIATLFLLDPTGYASRFFYQTGLISASSEFPLLINDSWGIGIILSYTWKEIPFITLMILAALKQFGSEYNEVGKTLNASLFQRIRYILLPAVFPNLSSASLIVFAYTFGAFEVPWLLGKTWPTMLPVQAYKQFSDIDLLSRPEGIATGMMIAIIVGIVYFLSQAVSRLQSFRKV